MAAAQNGISSVSAGSPPAGAAPVSPAASGSGWAEAPLPFAPAGLSRNCTRPARHQQDLGREAVGVLALLAPLAGLQLAVDVDQPAGLGVLLEHVDQPVLEGDDPVPLGLVDLAAGIAIDIRLVGRDAQVGDAAARGEVC